MRLSDRGAMIGRAREIGIRKSNSSKWGCAQNRARRRIPIFPEEKSRLRAHISMSPPVKDNAGDVTRRIEAGSGEHLGELRANLMFIVAERSGEKLRAAAIALSRVPQCA